MLLCWLLGLQLRQLVRLPLRMLCVCCSACGYCCFAAMFAGMGMCFSWPPIVNKLFGAA